jgi:class 3 adenylate cyclase/alpha-beta hydrolase superfamily lysophospholipase
LSETGIRQRLAAILSADAEGYSRLMAADERGTVAALDAARADFRTGIESHHGHVVDMAGDSVLAVFETANGAVSAALEIQERLARRSAAAPDRSMRFRIGIHLGDIFEKPDGTVYGDGVNIAARLQALGEPAGIVVSDAVYGAVRNRTTAVFADQGEHKVKNIPYPVRAYRVRPQGAATAGRDAAPTQKIRFCKSFDGTRIAIAVSGNGPPLVKASHWLSHLEYEWESPIWRPWCEALSRDYTLYRMDQRGCGLSDRGVADISFEAWVRDLEAMVDAVGLERFTLYGASQGAPIAIEFAARHPERVSRLVIWGGYARGWLRRGLPPERVAELEAQLKLVETAWGRDDASYRKMFAMQFMPGATLAQIDSLSELQRKSATPEDTVRIMRTFFEIDVQESLPKVRCPTLLIHATGDLRAPFEEGRRLAAMIPDARLVPLETNNHILLEHEPSFGRFFDELRAFIPRA